MHPPSVRGAVMIFADMPSSRLITSDSLPLDGSFCKPLPPTRYTGTSIPRFSVVKVLDQRTYVTDKDAGCQPSWSGNYPRISTWYRVIVLSDDGSALRDSSGRVIDGWDVSTDFRASTNPFADVREAKQKDGDRNCPQGAHKRSGYIGIVWNPDKAGRLPYIGQDVPVEVLGPIWRPWIFNNACLVRREDTGETIVLDRGSMY